MLKNEANQYQYLFLGGIIGEVLSLPFVGNYLKVNRSILKSLGIETTEHLTLNSFNAAHENAEELASVIAQLFKKHEKPLIILGHSKACLELVCCMMDYLPIFQEAVKKVICVQPPFKGSSIFEKYNFLKLAYPFWPGLRCLSENFYTKLYFEKIPSDSTLQAYLNNHLIVIKAYKTNSKDVSWIIRPSHLIMKKAGHQNDGLVKLKDQILPHAIYHELNLEMDHSDLFTSKLLSRRSDEFRKNVMVDLINSIV
jgi:hypothetical protein